MHFAVPARRLLARYPFLYWVICLLLAGGAAGAVLGQQAALDDERRQWGTTRAVLVASVEHRPGDPLRTERRWLPVAAVPPSAVGTEAGTGVARQRLAVGEVVVEADLAAPGGPAALADPGTSVVAVADPLARNVIVGLDVQIASEGLVIAERAIVVAVVDEVVFVAVDAADGALVASAARQGAASVIFVP